MSLKKSLDLPATFAEFFSGIGLMRMGLEKVGWKILFANDIDPMKGRLYETHFRENDNHLLIKDIHELNGNEVPSISLATASFPCTDLSLAGRRDGLSGKQSSAFWGFVEILEEMGGRKPPIILLENVAGFLTSNKGKDFEAALEAISELGYSVDAFMVDAVHFVPQSRLRLFVIGHLPLSQFRENLKLDEAQLSLFYESRLRPKKLIDFIVNHPDINWSLRPLPSLPKMTSVVSDIVDDIPSDSKEWWSKERVEYLLNQTSEKHKTVIDELVNKTEISYLTAFRRVRNGRSMAEIRSDGIAGCLRTPKGGSARQILLKVGKGEVQVRFITPSECARLMGANDFTISGTTTESLFGFGDAVCVPVVEWIAKNYLNPLLEEINISIKEKTGNIEVRAMSRGIS